jgi:general secretion pathway protein C
LPPPDVAINPPPDPLEQAPLKPASYYALIYKRDIFNSAKPVETPVVVAEKAAPTQLKLKLWGTAVNVAGSSYSIIEDQGARKQGVYGINAAVPGGATVKSIAWDQVVLLHNGKDEILKLENTVPVAKGAAPAPQPSPADASGIQETAENEYTVPRSEVDSAMENMSQLFTQVRAVPHFEGGESVGFRLFAIRRGSLFDKIGLKNGDIIRSINGNAMNDPAKAMGLMTELKDATNLSVEATRNSQPITLKYSIH